jgi:hypothetical protein
MMRKTIKLNKRVFVFIACLLLSFFIWLQINLSKKHTEIIQVKIDFLNLPKTKFGTTKISDTLFLEVEADGFSLFKYELKNISVDFRKLKKDIHSGSFYFLPNHYTKTISEQMGENFKVLRAMTDTIQLNPVTK